MNEASVWLAVGLVVVTMMANMVVVIWRLGKLEANVHHVMRDGDATLAECRSIRAETSDTKERVSSLEGRFKEHINVRPNC